MSHSAAANSKKEKYRLSFFAQITYRVPLSRDRIFDSPPARVKGVAGTGHCKRIPRTPGGPKHGCLRLAEPLVLRRRRFGSRGGQLAAAAWRAAAEPGLFAPEPGSRKCGAGGEPREC